MKPRRFAFIAGTAAWSPRLARVLWQTEGKSLMGVRRRAWLYGLVRRLDVPGEIAELGAHRGGSAATLAAAAPDRTVHVFDRWGDLPEPTAEDGEQFETYRRDRIPEKLATLDEAARECRELLGRYPNAVMHPGWFHETLSAYSGGRLALAHIDCDYYQSVREALAFVDQHASPGCLVISDNYDGWEGERQAVDEWAAARGIEAEWETAYSAELGPVFRHPGA